MYTVSYLQSNFSLNKLQAQNQNSWTKEGKKTSVTQMAWDFWILSRVHLHLKSVLVSGLVKCLSVILQRTSFLMQLHPIWPYWASPLIANRFLKSSPHPPDSPSPTETHGSETWDPASEDVGFFVSSLCFNFGLRSIHFKNPILKSKYYCGLLLGMSKKHNDLSLTL